jgi:RNA polymerase sigma-70 factor (ECF subfamily)
MALYFFHGDAAAASDVTQQVFLKLMTTISQFRGDAGFSTWLYRLVVNTCMDGARKRRSQAILFEPSALEDVVSGSSQEQELASTQMTSSVQMAVSTLPPKFRMAVLLRYFDDLSYQEMAKIMQCSMGTVASRLSRGHQLLAEKLAAHKNWFTTGSRRVR